MAAYYLDTSALVKRYVRGPGTDWVMEFTRPAAGHDIYVSRLAGPEIIAAFFRKARVREVAHDDGLTAAENFRADFVNQYQIVELTEGIVDRAMTLAQQHALRGYDAMQLAAVSELHAVREEMGLPSPTFVCADVDLNDVAESEGLTTEDPNLHN